MTDTITVELLDDDNYPTDEADQLIRNWTGTPRALVEDVIGALFDAYGHVQVIEALDDSGRPVIRVRLATGGWSGCEQTISALKGTWFWFGWWVSSRRGGVFEFEIPESSWDEPMTAFPQLAGGPLEDTAAVADFMRLLDQTVRPTPTTDITDNERAMRPRIVLEEALEFVEAMGCTVTVGDTVVTKKSVVVEIDPAKEIDLVEATDALGDIIDVTKGSALTLGIPVDDAFRIIHVTNLAKAGGPRRPDGKVLKPEGWVGPTEALRELLITRGATLV